MWHWDEWSWATWLGMALMMLAMVVLFGLLAWLLLRAFTDRRDGKAPEEPDAAVEELRLRYARGEMGREEYEERRRALSGPGGRSKDRGAG